MGFWKNLLGIKNDNKFLSKSTSKENKSYKIHIDVDIQKTVQEIIPLTTRIKNAYPSNTGLYPHEIIALDYANHFTTTQKDFQSFWLYRYSIDNMQNILKSLLQRGYLTIGGIESTLNNKTLTQLKSVLQSNGLKITGKKSTLIQSLLMSAPEEKLWEVFPEKYYLITEKGIAELEKNKYVVVTHKLDFDGLSPWSVNKLIHENPNKSYSEIILDYLLKNAQNHYEKKEYGLYRNTLLSIYFFLKQQKQHNESFRYLAEVMYVDLSGCGNSFSMEPCLFEISAKHFFPYRNSFNKLPPAAVGWLNDIETTMGWSDAELECHLIEQMNNFIILY